MKAITEFVKLMRAATYDMLYSSLLEMGACAEELKAFEEYKESELQDIQAAGAWVREWQQAKVSELTKNAYTEECNRKKREIWQRRYAAAMQRNNEENSINWGGKWNQERKYRGNGGIF